MVNGPDAVIYAAFLGLLLAVSVAVDFVYSMVACFAVLENRLQKLDCFLVMMIRELMCVTAF